MKCAGQPLATKGAGCLLLSAALSVLAPVAGHAQLNYLSDSRSVSGLASVSPSIAGTGQVLSYSGDYSGVSSPSAPFADFSSHASGTASLVYQMNVAPPDAPPRYFRSSSSVSVDASQTSFLHSGEISFSASESGPGHLDPGAYEHGAASLLVSFSVSSPVDYNLSCLGTGDPSSSWSAYSLSSANLGVLASGDTGTMLRSQQFGVPLLYSGIFLPGDLYTLDLSSTGFGSGGGLVSDLTVVPDLAAVPEPSALALAGAGLALFCCRRARRSGLSTP